MSKSKTTIAQVTDWFLAHYAAFRGWPRCSICRERLMPGERIQWDHVAAESMGGAHSVDNLRPVHFECHKLKSRADVQALAKIDRITGKTKGRPKRKWAKGRKMQSASRWPNKAHSN